MITFLEFAGDSHKDGTYIEYKLSQKSAEELKNKCEELGISNILDPSTFHTTIIYSRKPCPDAVNFDFPETILATPRHWSMFDTQKGGKCLVLEVNSRSEFEDIHNYMRANYDAEHGFPEYKPHVTISYDYDKDKVPDKVPDILLHYDRHNVKPLDPEFDPSKAKNGE
jgi:2'-5' RNA ligase